MIIAIELHFLPAYAPHLNPDELAGADLKRTLADQVIIDRFQMERSVRAFFHRVQKLPTRVLSYFQAPHTKYVSSTIEFGCEVLRWSSRNPLAAS